MKEIDKSQKIEEIKRAIKDYRDVVVLIGYIISFAVGLVCAYVAAFGGKFKLLTITVTVIIFYVFLSLIQYFLSDE